MARVRRARMNLQGRIANESKTAGGSGSERIDRERKLPIYARERVSHVWLVDPLERMIEVFRLDGDGYRLVVTRRGTDRVRLEPFGAIELEVCPWPSRRRALAWDLSALIRKRGSLAPARHHIAQWPTRT